MVALAAQNTAAQMGGGKNMRRMPTERASSRSLAAPVSSVNFVAAAQATTVMDGASAAARQGQAEGPTSDGEGGRKGVRRGIAENKGDAAGELPPRAPAPPSAPKTRQAVPVISERRVVPVTSGRAPVEVSADAAPVPPAVMLARLSAALRPIAITEDASVRSAGFMQGTREWLRDDVLAWANGEVAEEWNSRMFLLLSLPGMGKTAFAAHMTEVLEDEELLLAGHFCRAGDEARSDARSIIQSIVYQVASRIPEALSLIYVRVMEEGGLEGTATELCRRLLVEPLVALGDQDDQVIVIDAVDEAGTHDRNNELLSLLQGELQNLPSWVRMLVTSRPENYIVKRLEGYRPFMLRPNELRNIADIRAFIRGSLRADLGEDKVLAITDLIQKRSEGVFAYVAAVVRMVQRDAGGMSHLTLGDLPEGHRHLYAEYLNRQFASGALSPAAQSIVRDRLLPAIAVAREPLRVADLHHLAGPGAAAADVEAAVDGLGSLFPVDAWGLVAPFHKSVVDWLLQD